MAEVAPKASLLSLPPELLMGSIIPPSINLDVTLKDRLDFASLADLRSLSQTCRRLREFTLHLVWARVEVKTVKQLGVLPELMHANSQIASSIRSFRFLWHMDGDCGMDRLTGTPRRKELRLISYFAIRLHMWDDLMKRKGAVITSENGYFFVDGQRCHCPGKPPDWPAIVKQGFVAYDWRAGKRGRGPDGQGEDKLVKNAEQFTQCITEVVSMLPSLETFGWETPVTPMPRGVFDALAQLTTLTDLRLVFTEHRGNLSDIPLWELCGNLRALSVDHQLSDLYCRPLYGPKGAEATLVAITGHPQAPSDYVELLRHESFRLRADTNFEQKAREAVHATTAARAIVAALTGDNLQRLHVFVGTSSRHAATYQFHIRAFLPYWVRIEDWALSRYDRRPKERFAAAMFRRFLAHASHRRDWLNSPSNSRMEDPRSLTRHDLLHLGAYFNGANEKASLSGYMPCNYKRVVADFLPWLIEDAELAQQVLDAWNAIVERGEADKHMCRCFKCGGS